MQLTTLVRTMTLAALVAAGGACDDQAPRGDDDPLAGAATEQVRLPQPGPKADGGFSEVTHGIRWLSERSEAELAALFAAGSATHIPTGVARQQPLVSWYAAGLSPIVQLLFQGTDWRQLTDAEGAPRFDAGGEPEIKVYSVYLGWLNAPYVAEYAGVASRSTVAELEPISGAAPPEGWIWPHWLSPYREPIRIDDRPSVFVDYQGEPTPILGRAIDEFREVDPEGCPGLYLVRTHYLRSSWWDDWAFLFYLASDFGPADRTCDLDRLL